MEDIQKFVRDASATWRSVDSQFARKQFDLDSKGRKIDKQQYPGQYAAYQDAKQLLDAQKARKLYPYNSSKERDSRKYLEELEAALIPVRQQNVRLPIKQRRIKKHGKLRT